MAASQSKANAKDEIKLLEDTISSTLILVQKFNVALSSTSSQPSAADSLDPLDVIHTSANLLKAHTTKLSLLIINQPFTPSAIRKIIKEVASTCLPALVSAVGLCSPGKYGKTIHEESKSRVRQAFRGLESLMQEVLNRINAVNGNGSGSGGSSRQTQPASTTNDILPSTAFASKAWDACDSLMELKNSGLVGILVWKAKQYHSILKDAIEEIKAWKESDEADDEDTNEHEDALEDSDGENSIEKMLGDMQKLPRDRVELKAALEGSLKKLRLVNSLYEAVIKRRLRTIPPAPFGNPPDEASEFSPAMSTVTCLDQIMDKLRALPDEVDELVGAFYEFDEEEVQRSLAIVCDTAKAIVKYSSKNWEGAADEYTQWTTKWIQAFDQT